MNVFYRVLRFLTRKTLQIYFKNISFSGLSHFRKKGAQIIVVNHPTSFLEACILACFLPRSLYFIVRGDVFYPWARFFFRWTHQIPIYRFQDGFGNLRRNATSFEEVYKVLGKGKSVLIFAEGRTEYEKKLRPIQRGAGRMAVGALRKYEDLDLHIQVAGINYENLYRFRSHVHVHLAAPFEPELTGKDAVDISQITQRIRSQLSELVIQLQDLKREAVFDRIAGEKGLFELPARRALEPQRALASEINEMDGAHLDGFEKSKSPIEEGQKVTATPFWKSLFFQIIYILLFPFYYFPAYLSRRIVKSREEHLSFQQPIIIALSMFFYLVWIFLLAIVFFYFISPFWLALGSIIIFVYFGASLAPVVWEKWQMICK
ncbi:MAG: hypothetical protein GVX96_04800 [Bacteroidetes bacterium]|jgi:1-acyl-sn-glycerol-3-phosphate acyltransferase|nr:hypothetical protein [Bacteroidota bacterium]